MDDKAALALARAAIAHGLGRGAHPAPSPAAAGLDEERGVFVTLRIGGELRGCIGSIEPDGPLGELIPENARAAAFEDPRFEPLTPEELDEIEIELSILSTPEPMPSDPEHLRKNVKIGKHGLIVAGPSRRGILLPQVATENKMSVAEFLGATCWKAGLPHGSWQVMPERLQWWRFTVRIVVESGRARA